MPEDPASPEAVCIFDLNLPRDSLQESFRSAAPDIMLYFLPARRFQKKSDKTVLRYVARLARAHPQTRFYFVTRDKKFKDDSGYMRHKHPFTLVVVTFASRKSIPAVVPEILAVIRADGLPSSS